MDMLQIRNGRISDAGGKPVQLRGTCVGGWMNMENFINGYPGSEVGVRAAVAEILGSGKAEFFFDRMLDNMLGEEDIRFLKECGSTVVRLPLNYRHFEDDKKPFAYKESGFQRLNKVLGWCEKYGLYAILDLHAVQGWQNTDWHCDNDSAHTLFWEHPHFIDRFVALWEEFARRYKDNRAVAGYDVMNEPLCNAPRGRFTDVDRYGRNWDRINTVFHSVVDAIRRIDPQHIIFLEGDYFASLFDGFEAPFTDNLAYSSHNYTASGFGPGAYPGVIGGTMWDRDKQLNVFLSHEGTKFTQKYNVPLWVGEFGSVYNGAASEKEDRLSALDEQIGIFETYGAHWTTWTYKDVGVMGWTMLDPESDYMQLVKHELEAKRLLDTDQWMGWLPETPAKDMIRSLADYARKTIGDTEIEPGPAYDYLKQRALSGFVGSLMQPAYAKLFKGMSEERLDRVMDSFALKNCIKNNGLLDVVKKYMAFPAK
ncbi:MAG TPA: glycoside hydrolase family 5 protein [Clostridia bacterium]|nr:glycoside hydrolase family 5 protein [Clostridia bacterium]